MSGGPTGVLYVGAATIGTTEKGVVAPRVPVAFGISLAIHALGLVGFMRLSFKPPAENLQVIDNVDLMVQEEERKAAAPQRPRMPPPSMKDFLKLALPSIPKAIQPMDIKLPVEEKRLLDLSPKLEDRGRIKEAQKLASLDLDKRRPDLAKIAEPLVEKHDARALAALPKLEEVGVRQAARKTLALAALAEADRGRVQPQRLDALGSMAPQRRRSPQAAALLNEAAPNTGKSLSRLADLLTSDSNRVRLEPRAAPEPRREKLSALAETPEPPPARRAAAEIQQVKKKAVEIEGPLSNRQRLKQSIPVFPEWAREMGLVEAEVQIRFYVAPDGTVVGDTLRVERTSGFGRLDRLTMEHLKHWVFQASAGTGNEWGLITFRFLLE